MTDIFTTLWNKFGNVVFTWFPLSPFQPYLDQFADLPYLGYLNWFFPIGTAIQITGVWLSAIAGFYTYSVIFRWLKVIGN